MKINHKKLNVVLGLVVILMTGVGFWMDFNNLQNIKQDYCEVCVSNYKDKSENGISRITYADNKYVIKVNRDVNNLQKSGTGNFFDASRFTSYFMNVLKHNLSDKYKEIEYYQHKDKNSIRGIIWQSVDHRGITNNILFTIKGDEKNNTSRRDRFYLEVVKHPECEKGVYAKGQPLCKDEKLILTSDEIKTIVDEVLKRAGY
jgi:hypothetical protein